MRFRKYFVLFSLIVVVVISTGLGIAKLSLQSSKIVKEGKIDDIQYYRWDYASTVNWDEEQYPYGSSITTRQWSKPPNTELHFEDGETLVFVEILYDIEIGKKYRIAYHEQYVYAQGNRYWNGYYYVVDSIEEIK